MERPSESPIEVPPTPVEVAPTPPVEVASPGRGLWRVLSNHNPFYPMSAVLVLWGLRVSFDPQAGSFPAWAFLGGLAAYTLLLAATAWVLVRLGNVWDDVRTLLLLIVVVFLGVSMILDDVLLRDRRLGVLGDVGSVAFAIALSEALLRGMKLRLPWLYRGPYHAMIALAFLYPAAIAPLLDHPGSEPHQWALFGFSPLAALALLGLLPAIRRGAGYVGENGSPWRWPLYPWSLFVILGLGLAARAASLCWSLHAPSYPELGQSVFRPYFLVPIAMAAVVLLLELGIRAGNRHVTGIALALPALVLMLAVGTPSAGVSGRFQAIFTDRLGAGPLYLTVLLAAAFHATAALRRVPRATGWLTASLVLLAMIRPTSLRLDDLGGGPTWPLWILAILHGSILLRRPSSARALAVSTFVTIAATSDLMRWLGDDWAVAIGAHLAIGSAMGIGLAFRDDLARFLRGAGLAGLTVASLIALAIARNHLMPMLPPGLLSAYPLAAAALAIAYGRHLRDRAAFVAAGVNLTAWGVAHGWRSYAEARRIAPGLDFIVVGLTLFVLAAAISLAKAGVLRRWLGLLRAKEPPELLG